MALDSPHDAFFKEFFSQPSLAQVELRALLPAALSSKVDWDSLRLEPGSFVEVRDRDRFADLLFSAQVADSEVLLYLLFEHQSAPERLMPLRLLGYAVRKWEQLWRDDKTLRTLPPIVPVVLHHGEAGWHCPTSFHDLFAPGILEDLGITELVPSFRFALDDLSHESDAELLARAVHEGERIVPIVLWALRDSRQDERFLASLAAWAGALAEVANAPSGSEALLAVFSYISRVTQALSPHAILEAVERVAPQTKDIVMTLAEQWLQEGIEKGIQKGIQKGERAILEKQLALKFGPLSGSVRARLDSAAPADLELWAERILSAASIDEVVR